MDVCFTLLVYDEYKFKPVFYRGENAVYKFINDILKVGDKISFILNLNQEMIVTKKWWIQFYEKYNMPYQWWTFGRW